MISVVVCTFNGLSRIESCLSAILNQAAPPVFELIVVDNGSTDGTGEMVEKILLDSFSQGDWRLLQEKKPGLLQARIRGMKEARFEWVLFCDDDNVVFPDFLAKAVEIIGNARKIGVLGSHGIPEFSSPKPEWFDKYSSSYAVGAQLKDNSHRKHLDFVYGACSIYRKNPLLSLFEKGFVPSLSGREKEGLSSGDDVEWCALMQLLGFQIAYSPNLKFYHQIPVKRLSWEYYLKLKQGISSGAGLLFPYHYYFEKSIRQSLPFRLAYFKETIKSRILYYKYKYRWKGKPASPEDQLAFLILESKYRSFLENRRKAAQQYKLIRLYFGA